MVLHALTSLTYMVVAVARRLRYIGDYVKPMESFVGSFTPPKGGETYCSGTIIHIGGPALRIHGAVAVVPEARARESRIGRGLSFASVHRWKSNFQYDILRF